MSTPHLKHTVRASVEYITPAIAQELLGSNIQHQRKIAGQNLAKIESDMLNDRFRLNGEPIIVGASGKLLDGQHRLCSSVNTKKGFWSVVVRGVDDECFHIINVGKGRTLADVLKIAGEVNCSNLSATICRVVEYLRDSKSVGGSRHRAVSTAEAMDTLAMMPKLRDSVSATCFISSGEVIHTTRIAWLHCLTHEECPKEAKEFFAKLQTGEMLSVHSPIYLLRARMIADKQSKAKLRTREVLALLVKTWNAYITGQTLKQLKWSMDEPFPTLIFTRNHKSAAA